METAEQESDLAARRPRSYGKRRAAVLLGVHVLIAAHIIHWKIAGKTLAPLELNEVMYTLELGIVTAGFLLMVAAVLSVLIFGRFFCSWGCHILALEDLCTWLLERFHIRPKPVRSRTLLIVPPAALFYMFVWPQITRLWTGGEVANAHVVESDGAWASFVTDDFWRNLPDPWVALMTFIIVGFVAVYVLGSRAFCTYGCPYGALFAIADRVSPGRIIANDNCEGCGRCTAVCTSDILVHEEIRRHKQVVDPACLKDLDCVAECPTNALSFGFRTPAFFSGARPARKGRRFDFSLREDLVMALTMVASIAIFRGLYDAVPFLATLAIGAIVSFGIVVMLRLLSRARLSLRGVHLKQHGRLTRAGAGFLAVAVPVAVLVLHSAFVRYHEWRGEALFEELRIARAQRSADAYRTLHPKALRHFELYHRFGLVTPVALDHRLAAMHYGGPNPQASKPFLRALVAAEPNDIDSRLRLVYLAIRSDELSEAREELKLTLANEQPDDPLLREQIGRAVEAVAKALDSKGQRAEASELRNWAARVHDSSPPLPRLKR